MAAVPHPYIDIAVTAKVRERLAAGDAVLIVDSGLDMALFANGAGARLIGFDNPVELTGNDPELGVSARRQIKGLAFAAATDGSATIALRLISGVESRMVMVTVTQVKLPDGEAAIMLSAPADGGVRNAIDGLAGEESHAAVLGADGSILAASPAFERLGIDATELSHLAGEAARERDRMVKRRVRGADRAYPAGIGRISDEPAQYILLAIEDREETAPLKPAEETATALAKRATPSTGATGIPDRWYFHGDRFSGAASVGGQRRDSQDQARTPEAANIASASRATPQTATDDVEAASGRVVIDPESVPVRFTWKIDAAGFFSMVSPEFGEAVGKQAADVEGRTFAEVAQVFALDPSGDIRDLLERHDTWSGRSVLWPIEGTDLRAPVDLAALPVYDRERRFEGFRGFGIVRLADAVIDPEAVGLALVKQPAPETATEPLAPAAAESVDDPWRGEKPALEIVPERPTAASTEKVIQLDERRQPRDTKQDVAESGSLSTIERSAFREIAERLRRDGLVAKQASVEAQTAPPEADPIIRGHDEDKTVPAASAGVADASHDYDEAVEEDFENGDLADLSRLDGEHAENEVPDTGGPQPADAMLPPHPARQSDFVTTVAPEAEAIDEAPILARLPVPILVHTGAELLFANQSFFDLTGYSSLEALTAAGGLERLFVQNAREDGDLPLPNSQLLTAYEQMVPVRAHLHSVPWKGGHALLLSMRPIDAVPVESELNETIAHDMAALKQEVSELSSVLETATDGVVFVNQDGTIRAITQSGEALFGFDPAEVKGKPFTNLFATESQRAVSDYLSNLSGTGVASLMNDGREVIGREAHGRFIPLFMTIGRLSGSTGFCAVMRDITQWKRAEEELNAARRAAEHASAQKSEFLARVSHEIRTPLNAIIGFSDLMTEERFGPVGNLRYLDYLKDINRSGRHVLDLVNDLLDISKIEAGQQEMDFEAVSLNEALSGAVSMMQPQANRNRVIIRSSFAADLPEVVADLRSVKQIALNLLSNAVRYTPAGGQVTVSTNYELTGGVSIRVRDTGIGMTSQEVEQAMKPFKQINALNRGRGEGTGLGLPLTKAMAEANRANFAISSTPGQGTLVEITFPSTRVLAD